MKMIRCILFNICFYGVSALMCVVFLPALLMPRRIVFLCAQAWAYASLFFAHWVGGMKMEVRGRENRLPAPAIFACKHQSAWETLALTILLQKPLFVLKKELLFMPLFGLFLWRVGSVPINRSAGASAIKELVRETRKRLEEGHSIIIFPEGTRTSADNNDPEYMPGVSALYSQLDVPIVPVALNSGVCWGRKAFFKRPGTITIEFLPALPAGMHKKEFLPALKQRIETRSQALRDEEREKEKQY